MSAAGYPSGPVMIWELAGRPRRASLKPEQADAACAMCGRHVTESLHVKQSIGGKSFTDQYLLARRGSDRTCYGCAWVCTGKGMDQIRMWTIVARTDIVLPPSNPKAVFATDHLHFTSRADMRAVVDTLANPPAGEWLVTVAESGQKHTAPYAAINRGPGRWQVRMDARTITAHPDEFRLVFGHALALRHAGFRAEEITALDPPIGRLSADTIPIWFHHATPLRPYQASGLIHLATFLINKEHMDEYLTRYGPPGPRPGDADRMGDDVHVRDHGQRGRGEDRPETLVGPGPDRAGDGHGDGVLF